MNRFLLSGLLCCILTLFGRAQNVQICIQVVGSAGGSGAQGNYKVAYTVGEPVVTTLTGNFNVLTQGFHQPDVCQSVVSTSEADLNDWSIGVFPNPTERFLNIHFNSDKGGLLEAQVFDVLGRTVRSKFVLDISGSEQLDCSDWQPGVYFLRLQLENSPRSTIIRFIRI